MFVQFGALEPFDPPKCFTIKTVSNITIINNLYEDQQENIANADLDH